MADTILSGDIQVTYLDENRQKGLEWLGGAATTYTLKEIYSALQDLVDEPGQMDDETVMSAETPTEYTIGNIDSGAVDPWYITYEVMEHISGTTAAPGGSLKTAGWTHVDGTDTGIVVVACTSNTIVAADIGFDITSPTDSETGTLLDVIDDGGATNYLVIRPDDNTAANSFDNTTPSQVLTCNANTATQSTAATTGEQIWANLYNVTPIDVDSHVYMYQGNVDDATRARTRGIDSTTQDWWGEGAFDVCIFTKDYKAVGFTAIDSGRITCFVRKYSTFESSFEIATNTTSGGRHAVPLVAGADADNTTGYGSITSTAVSVDTFAIGDEILGATSGGRAIITQIDNPGATATYHFYLIDDPQINFQTAAESVTNEESGNTGEFTKDGIATAAQGPALSTWFTSNSAPTAAFATTTFDIDDDGTPEDYAITLDCNANPLAEVYEWCKYITRNGETTTGNTDGIEGEQYVGGTVFLDYGTDAELGGTIDEGDDVSQETSGATGIVISHSAANNLIFLRDTRGTFATGTATDHTVTSLDAGAGAIEMETADSAIATTFTATTASPFGTFPGGGTFFGARGVFLTDYLAADENNFSLVDIEGVTNVRPTSISITVTNLIGTAETSAIADRVAVFRLDTAGGIVDKTEYSAAGGETPGAVSLVVDSAITADTPGKSAGGVLKIRDASVSNAGYRIRYSSWATSTFTLATFASFVTTATTNETQVTYATGGFNANVKRGDLVYNSDRTAHSYVLTVDSDTQLTLTSAITNQVATDNVAINVIPNFTVDTLDDVYVPMIDLYATAATESVSFVYLAQLDFRTRVRNVISVAPDGPIKPFEVDGVTSGTNQSIPAIRTIDTIFT